MSGRWGTADTFMSPAVYKPIKAEAPLERPFVDFQLNQAAPTFFDSNLPACFPSSSRPRADSDVRQLNQLRFRSGQSGALRHVLDRPGVTLMGHKRGVSPKCLFFPPYNGACPQKGLQPTSSQSQNKRRTGNPSGFSNNLGFCLLSQSSQLLKPHTQSPSGRLDLLQSRQSTQVSQWGGGALCRKWREEMSRRREEPRTCR